MKFKQQKALLFLGELEDNSIDLILTDPPYSSLEKHRKVGTTTRLKKKWFDVIPNDDFKKYFEEFYRVLKPNTHCYVMCDQETMFHFKAYAEMAGFRFWKFLIWDKVNMGMGYHYRARHELIMFFEKGKRKLNDLSIPDILVHKKVYRKYPTQKPVSLFEEIIQQSSQKEEIVLDPFCGAGTIFEACINTNRIGYGCDTSEEAKIKSIEVIANYHE